MTPTCNNKIHPERVKLGYKTCIECGSPVKQYTIAPAYNKGAYQLVSNENLKDIGRK